MTTLIDKDDEHGLLSDAFLWNLKITRQGKIKEVNFDQLFNKFQRAAIIRFLKYLIHHNRKWQDSDAQQRLDEIQNRTYSQIYPPAVLGGSQF